jgi:hypothetical protein
MTSFDVLTIRNQFFEILYFEISLFRYFKILDFRFRDFSFRILIFRDFVFRVFFSRFLFSIFFFSGLLQKFNQIGAQGAEHLANALQQNKVTLLTPLNFLCRYSFIICYRHSQHLTSHTTKSVLKAQNILQMRCSKTR